MTTADTALARRLSTRLDTLWDFDYEPTYQELASLYETAKRMYGRDAHTGFRSIQTVWAEMGWDAEATWLDTGENAATIRVFNRLLFTGVLIPRLQRIGVLTSRVEVRYREIGLLDA